MGKKMNFPDYALKIISLLIAVGLWIYVSYVENPKSEYWYKEVPVVYINDNLKYSNLKRVVDTEEKHVAIKVRGTRSAIMGVSSEDIVASVNLSSVKNEGRHNLPYTVSFPIDGFEIVDKKPYLVTVDVDEIVTKSFELKLEALGTPDKGHEVGEITSNISSVDVTGPEELIGEIAGCTAFVDVEGKRIIKKTPAEIKVILEDGSHYSGADLSLSNTYANVTVDILYEKELAVNINLENTGTGEVTSVTAHPEKVRVKGPAEILDGIEALDTETVYVSEYDREKDAVLVLPEGVSITDGTKTVRVKAEY